MMMWFVWEKWKAWDYPPLVHPQAAVSAQAYQLVFPPCRNDRHGFPPLVHHRAGIAPQAYQSFSPACQNDRHGFQSHYCERMGVTWSRIWDDLRWSGRMVVFEMR